MALALEWALPAPPPSDRPRLLVLSEQAMINKRLPPILPYTRFELSPSASAGVLAPLKRVTKVHEHYRAAYDPLLGAAHQDLVLFRQRAWRDKYDWAGNGTGRGTADLVQRAVDRGGKSVPSLLVLERRSRTARTLKRLGIHPASVARPSPLRSVFAYEEEGPEQAAAVTPVAPSHVAHPMTPPPPANPNSPDPIVFVGAFFELCDRTLRPSRAPRRHTRQRSNIWPGSVGTAAAHPKRAKTTAAPKNGRSRAVPTVTATATATAAALEDVLDRGPMRKSSQLGRQLNLLSEQLVDLARSRRNRVSTRRFPPPLAAAQRVPVV
ncbi:uncharacterized protein LOC62_05G007402 [Vanrija pseudolonga]|uniref:Uncharacterized protein n=1 Tax=Vanrija pseudolonga TaxID=143232 RepID=A0AAF0YDD1_9TREE|nr:hypothetical protein LOC62_05G007402 [Vanrija pseudolonga]